MKQVPTSENFKSFSIASKIESNTLNTYVKFSDLRIWLYLPLQSHAISQLVQLNQAKHIFPPSVFAWAISVMSFFSMMQLNYHFLWNVVFFTSYLKLSVLSLTLLLCFYLFPHWQLMIKSIDSVRGHKCDVLVPAQRKHLINHGEV